MKNTRAIIVSVFVLIALFFIFRSAEASPSSVRQPASGGYPPVAMTDPSMDSPAAPQAPDVDADLAVSLLDAPDPVLVTRSLTYTLTVTNQAITMTVTNVVVTDTLPASVSFVSATPLQGSCSGTSKVRCELGSILAGGSTKVKIVVIPNTTGLITNSAFARATENDPNLTNNTATADTTVNPLADLSLTLKVSNATPYLTSTIAYTVTVTNSGPSQATGVIVRDLLPAGYAYVSNLPSQGSYNPSTGDWTVGALNNAASATLRLNATVNTSGSYSNYAQVWFSNEADPDSIPGNNSTTEDDNATLATSPLPMADLSISKTGSTSATAGTALAYTLTPSNAGPSPATSVTVTDTLPLGVTYVSASGTGWACSIIGRVVSCTRSSLGTGSGPTIGISVNVNPDSRGIITNSSRISSAVGDTNPANNLSTLNTTVTGIANLSLTMKVSNTTPQVGSSIAFTVTVTNAGPSQATGVSVKDLLPAGYTFINAVQSQGSYVSGTGIWTIGSINPDISPYLRLNVTVNASGPYSNYAQVWTSNETDPNSTPGDNSTTQDDDDTLTPVPIPVANLSLTKTHTPTPVAAGSILTYTLSVTNSGPSAAAALVLTDTLPAGVTYQPPAVGTWTCTLVSTKLRCTLASLPAGQNSQVKIRVLVSPSLPAGTLNNAATLRSGTFDSNLANNDVTDPTNVIVSSNLAITKVDKPDPVVAGSTLVYTLTVTNTGPSDAAGVTISDTLPVQLTNASTVPNPPTCKVQSRVLDCTLGAMGAGSLSKVVVTGTVAAGTPSGTQLNNAAVVNATTPDPVSANNRATQATTVTASANLAITKVDRPDPVVAGTNLVYTLTVANAGPSDAVAVAISDTLPAVLTNIAVTSGSWACVFPAQRVNCNLSGLALGASSHIVVTARVAEGTPNGTQLNNAAVVSATTPDPVSANNRATQVTVVTTSADLAITKVDRPDPVVAGTNLVYTLTVTNAGPSTAVGVTISDTLPAALTVISVSPGTPTCTVTNQLLSCNLGNMLGGGSSRIVVTSKVNSATLPGTLSNSARAGSTTSDPVAANNRATQTTAVTTLADPSIIKLDKPDNGVVAGTNLVYTLTVSNAGPSNAANLVVSDTLPASVTYQTIAQGPFSCSYDSGTKRVTCNLDTLAPSGTARAVITTKVNSSTPIGTIHNAVTTTSTTTDSNPTNNRSTQNTTVTTQANLSIVKLDGPDPVIAGTNLVYTLTVTDAGASDAFNLVLTDTLPSGLTYQSFSGVGWTCTNPVALKVRCTRPSLTAGTNSSVHLTSKVGSGVSGSLFNSAVVVSDVTDPNPGNNSANASTTVIAVADVGVTKIHKPEPVIGGTNLVYTITVANSGPSDSQNVVLTENLPVGTAFVSMNMGGAACTQVLRTITCSFTPIIAGTNRQVVVTALVASGTTGIINNVAALNGSGGAAPNNRTTDLNIANDSYTDPANIITRSDFALIKTDKPDPVVAGTNLVYTLTVTNNGPSNSADAVVTDTLPAGVTYQSYAGTGWTCALLTGARVRCSRLGMNADTSSSVAITVLVNSGTTLPLSNSAVVGSSTVDPQTANNTALQATTVTTQSDLSVTKLDKPDPVIAGTNLTYTVTVSNLGPSDAVGVVFTDTLPSAVVYQSFTGANWSCTLNGVRLRCTRLTNLVTSTNDKVVILSHVKSATTGSLSNSVLVHSSTTDLVPGNNTKTEATTVNTSADLKISKVDTVDPVAAGTGMAYTIVITNTGPSDAVGVRITDTLPVGVSYVTHVPTPEWTCLVVSGQLRCSRAAAVVASARLQIDVAVLVDPNVTGTLNNLVRVGATTADPVTANNSDTELTTIAPQADLSIAKVESVDPVIAGTNLTYTLTVSNAGPSQAANLVVTDTLPANVTYQSFGGSSGWSCALLTGNRLRCTRANLNKSASSTISIATKVLSSATGSLSNTAIVRNAWTDPSLTNNSVTIGTTINTRADLSVDKTDSPDPVAEGQVLTYKVVVKNLGPSDAVGVSLNESIPSEVTFVSALAVPQGTCSGSGPVICGLGNLVSGNSITITVTTNAKLVANQIKNISNTATASTTTIDPIPANDSKTISTQVLPIADLRIHIASQASQVLTGQTMTYTLWITNTGPSIANNVIVTDTLPVELTFKSSTLTPTVTSPKVVWHLGNLPVGNSTSFRLVVNVKSPTKTLVNLASTKSNVWDIFPANSQDQVSIQAIDNVEPTATWELPVKLGQRYDVGNQILRLEVLATDNVAVSYVRFYRWNPLIPPVGDFVDIGYDYTAETCQFNPALMCYHWDLDTSTLNPQYNETRARAFDASGNASPSPSLNSFIWLYYNVSQVFLPLLQK